MDVVHDTTPYAFRISANNPIPRPAPAPAHLPPDVPGPSSALTITKE
ncbi:hypothetical protein QWJ26_00865 [Streptomyces sp. CSDS2]|nr:hypothetical protein [Streptomyces sp. CSDS2]MDN3258383.1 hypothetical protein [Streptomyces sp. CSDS2]